MSRKVADVFEFSEINLIDGTFCCSGLQFHLFSSVLSGLIKRYPFVKVYCGEVLNISIQLLRHFQACPLPLSPLSTPRDICSTLFFEKLRQIPNRADGKLKHKPRHRAEDMKKASSRRKTRGSEGTSSSSFLNH